MTQKIQSVEFFKSFTDKKIEEITFIEQLQQLTTQIQQRHSLNDEQQNIIFQSITHIEDQTFNANIELFIKFSMYLADKAIYAMFESYEFNFEFNFNSGRAIDVNLIALYIISRVYKTENPKVLLLFLNGLINQVKQIEKKYVLLEFYIFIISIIDKKELHYQDILPLILKVTNEGLEKYFQYVKQQKDGDLNQKNQFVLSYLKNFQKWTSSIFKRIFYNLSQIHEIKQFIKQKVQAIQDLLSVNDLYDYDPIQDQIFLKAEVPSLAVKHLVLLFLFDLIHGILEAKMSAQSNNLDPKILDDLYQQIIRFLNEIHQNKLELIENYLQFVRFSLQREIQMNRTINRYNIQLNYNPVSIAHLTHQLLFENKQENHEIQQIISLNQKLKLALGVLYEQKFIQSAKTDVQEKLIYSMASLLSNQKKLVFIDSPAYFLTHLHKLILIFLEKAGSGISKEDEIMFIDAWKSLSTMISLECYTGVILESLQESDNIQLLAHLINHYRMILSSSLKNNKNQIEEYFRYVDVIHNQIMKKTQVGTIDTKIQIIDSIILIQKILILNYSFKTGNEVIQRYYSNWKKYLTKYEKDIQLNLNYMNEKKLQLKKQEKQEVNQEADLVFHQLLSQENIIQIVYYNLQDLISLYTN